MATRPSLLAFVEPSPTRLHPALLQPLFPSPSASAHQGVCGTTSVLPLPFCRFTSHHEFGTTSGMSMFAKAWGSPVDDKCLMCICCPHHHLRASARAISLDTQNTKRAGYAMPVQRPFFLLVAALSCRMALGDGLLSAVAPSSAPLSHLA